MNRHSFILLSALCLTLATSPRLTQAACFVSGNVSGTWSNTCNPYIVTANLTVPLGQTLTIQPGVTLIMGQGLNMNVQGTLLAVGTCAQPIFIKGATPSQYWDTIKVTYNGGAQSAFVNCKISDATNAVQLVTSSSAAMIPQVSNCTFSNCLASCIYGWATSSGLSPAPRLLGSIKNCRFSSSSNAVYLDVNTCSGCSNATNSMTVANNVFHGMTGAAVWLSVRNFVPAGSPKVENNIFFQCSTAVRKTGSATAYNEEISYNCFYGNATNFVGVQPFYGSICCVNSRGTPCDVVYDIFENPLFADTISYMLAPGSLCVDAGDTGGAYLDTCFPPSLGTTANDIGAYGGPYAGGSLTNCCSTTNLVVTLASYRGVTIYPIGPGRYQLDYTSDLTNGPWFQATNLLLTNTPYTYIDLSSPINPKRYYRAVLLP
jgi:hypothetical protein